MKITHLTGSDPTRKAAELLKNLAELGQFVVGMRVASNVMT